MLIFHINNVKNFMAFLLKGETFDAFEVRQINVATFATYEISGILDKSFFLEEEQPSDERKYCLWSELKPIVFQLVKGKRLPKYIKLILSASNKTMAALTEQASAMFLNITFENNEIACQTGSSQKVFSMNRIVDETWDQYIIEFFQKNQISITQEKL